MTGVGGVQPATVDLGDGPVPVIQIPLDTWGYAQVFAANGGTKPNKDSLFYKKGHFAVELIREESAQAKCRHLVTRYVGMDGDKTSLHVCEDCGKEILSNREADATS